MKHKRKEHGIRWKLFAFFTLFSVVMILLLWLFQIILLKDFYRFIKTTEIYQTAQEIEKKINSKDLENTINKISRNKDICISFFNDSGEMLYSSNTIMNCIIHRIPAPLLYSIVDTHLINTDTYFEEFSPRKHITDSRYSLGKRDFSNSILVAHRLYDTNGNTYTLVLNSVIEPVYSTTTTLRTQLIYVSLIMLALSFFLSWWISKKIAKPIININESAKKLPEEYNLEFNDSGYKEISELAATLTNASKELSKVENLRRDLIANVSHDLRTPLTMITGYAEMMRDVPGENTPENVQIIIDEAKRLSTLVSDVLDISKLQQGNLTLNLQTVNITNLIRNILTRYTKLTEKESYQIHFDYTQDIEIQADETKLTQVIYNLINNAITYTGDDKQIFIKQTKTENSVKIEIIDTGNGVDEEEIPYIWDRYYKAKGNHKRDQIGTGLGLAIVKEILTLHDAEFGVKNTEEQGANFWFEMKINNE